MAIRAVINVLLNLRLFGLGQILPEELPKLFFIGTVAHVALVGVPFQFLRFQLCDLGSQHLDHP